MIWCQIYHKLITFITVDNYTVEEYWNFDILTKFIFYLIHLSTLGPPPPLISCTKIGTSIRVRGFSVFGGRCMEDWNISQQGLPPYFNFDIITIYLVGQDSFKSGFVIYFQVCWGQRAPKAAFYSSSRPRGQLSCLCPHLPLVPSSVDVDLIWFTSYAVVAGAGAC